MVIDVILDRKGGVPYSPDKFYRYAMGESEVFGGLFDGLTRAMDFGTEEDVRRELKKYIIEQGYNPEICNYIDSVSWFEPDDKILRFEKKNGFYGTVTWNRDDLENALDVMGRNVTAENVDKMIDILNSNKNMEKFCEAMIEAGWSFLYGLIESEM